MIDGLALGETTPGPLIMIVAFVGFVGGWTKVLFGPDHLLLAGVVARLRRGLLHLPAFVHLHPGRRADGRIDPRQYAPDRAADRHLGGRGRRDGQPGAVLRLHVFRLDAPPAQWDWAAIGICALASLALLRYKAGTIKLILACAAAGLVLSYLR